MARTDAAAARGLGSWWSERGRRFLVILAMVLVAFPACARRAETQMVAMTIGDRRVLLEDVEYAFWEYVRTDSTGADTSNLRAFIPVFTRQLLTEAVAREEVPELFGSAADRHAEQSELLVINALRDEIYGDSRTATDAELRRAWEMHGRKLRLRLVSLPTKAEADLAERALREGAVFQKVAEQRSLDASKASGGDIGWITYADIDPILRNRVFSLKVGEIGGPWQIGEQWQIFRVEDEAPNTARGTIEQERRMLAIGVTFERVTKLRERYHEDLFTKHNFRMDPAEVAWMTAFLHEHTAAVKRGFEPPPGEDPEETPIVRSESPWDESPIPPADSARVIASFDHPEGRVTPDRVLAHLMTTPPMAWPRFQNPRDVEKIIREYALERLEYKEALARGIDKRPDVQRKLARMTEEIRSRFFYRTRLRATADFSDEDAMRYYERHLDEYTRPERRRFQGLNTADRNRAFRICEMLRAGKTPEEVALAFPEDPTLQSTGSRGTPLLTRGESPVLDDVLFELPLHGVSDPLEIGSTYTVSRVIEVHPARPRPFEEVRTTVRAQMTKAYADSLLEERLTAAREKYPIEIHWDVIQKARLEPPATDEG